LAYNHAMLDLLDNCNLNYRTTFSDLVCFALKVTNYWIAMEIAKKFHLFMTGM